MAGTGPSCWPCRPWRQAITANSRRKKSSVDACANDETTVGWRVNFDTRLGGPGYRAGPAAQHASSRGTAWTWPQKPTTRLEISSSSSASHPIGLITGSDASLRSPFCWRRTRHFWLSSHEDFASYLDRSPMTCPARSSPIFSPANRPRRSTRYETRPAPYCLGSLPATEARIQTMTLPTGTGKTLLGATWALTHRQRLAVDRLPTRRRSSSSCPSFQSLIKPSRNTENC